MALFNIFKKPEPPPKPPWYKKNIIAIVAVILTIIGMFVVGPIHEIYVTMAEDIKTLEEKKASKETIQEMLKQQEILIKQNEKEGERRSKAIEKNQEAIQQLLIAPPKVRIMTKEPPGELTEESNETKTVPVVKRESRNVLVSKEKKVLTPEQFDRYLDMSPDKKIKYKEYLKQHGYEVAGLPDE